MTPFAHITDYAQRMQAIRAAYTAWIAQDGLCGISLA